MDRFIQVTINGLSVGGLYALVAVGFVLIFGVARVLNIAQVQYLMASPVIVLLATDAGMSSTPVLLALALIGVALLGLLVHVVAVEPFHTPRFQTNSVSALSPFIATLGVGIALENVAAWWIGSEGDPFPLQLTRRIIDVNGVLLSPVRLTSLSASVVLMLLLWLVLYRSDFGIAVRAVAEDGEIAQTTGVSRRRVERVVALIAALLAGTAGLLFASINNQVGPYMGVTFGIYGLVAVVVGGIQSIGGTVATAVALGVVEACVTSYLSSTLVVPIVFSCLIAALLWRPRGLFARGSEPRLA